jgi:hypothetical protein
MSASLYEQDFYAWANQQAALLRAGELTSADILHIAEEIESMGKAEKRELMSRLTVLMCRLLKWQYQPERRGLSWRATIRNQRRDLSDHLDDNSSLRSRLPESLAAAYERARDAAAGETDLGPGNLSGPLSVVLRTGHGRRILAGRCGRRAALNRRGRRGGLADGCRALPARPRPIQPIPIIGQPPGLPQLGAPHGAAGVSAVLPTRGAMIALATSWPPQDGQVSVPSAWRRS